MILRGPISTPLGRVSDARSAPGRLANKTSGIASAVIHGTRSIQAEFARDAFTTGPLLSVCRAHPGLCILIGMYFDSAALKTARSKCEKAMERKYTDQFKKMLQMKLQELQPVSGLPLNFVGILAISITGANPADFRKRIRAVQVLAQRKLHDHRQGPPLQSASGQRH